MRIIDCFPYFDEKELLELRINLLYEHVDKFIICDADRSYDGKPKPFTCKNVIDTLGLPKEKIQILEVNLPNNHINSWTSPSLLRERMQRNAAESLMEDDDIFIISNLDEIINPDFIEYYSNVVTQNPNNILRIPMAFLKDGANSRVYGHDNQPITWNAAFLCMKNHLNEYTFSDIRESYIESSNHIKFSNIFVTENNVIEDAGWKFFISNNSNQVAEDHILKPYPSNLLPQKIFDLDRVKNFLIPNKTPQENFLSDNRIVYKKISKMGLNQQVVFDYLNSKFNKNEKNYRILDVGAGANPWSIDWITHVADIFTDPEHVNNFNKDIKIFNVDINDPRDWEVILKDVETHGKFDFVICSHTLEDINNPKIACEMINRIGKSGYISMPSKYAELFTFEYKSNCGLPYKGYHHHRWIYKFQDNVLIGFPKMNFYDYVEFDFDYEKAYGTEISFLWEGEFKYDFINPDQMLDNRVGPNKLMDLFEDDDLILI